MPQFTSPNFERVVVQPQTTFNTVPNTGGTWTTTGAKLIRSVVNGCKIKADPPLVPVPWKTGTRSPQPGIVGRKSNATFALTNLPVIPSGTAGTAPDADCIFQGIFGAAPTVSAGVSVSYAFADSTFKPFIVSRFQHGFSGLTNQFGIGAIPTDFSLALNGDIFTMGVNGPLFWALDSENFANEDTAGLAGLTSFPAELSSPTVAGSILQGFTGIATFDGNGMDTTTAPLVACSIRGRTGAAYVLDAFGNAYPALPVGGPRSVSLSCTFADTDASALNNLKVKAKSKTPLNVTIQVGTTAGAIVTMTLKSVQLSVPDYADDNARVTVAFGESPAHATAIANVDDFTVVFT